MVKAIVMLKGKLLFCLHLFTHQCRSKPIWLSNSKKESHGGLDWQNDDRFLVFKITISLIRLMILFWVCVECCIPASWMLFWASCQTKMLLTALLREVRQHWGWKGLGNVHHKIAWCTIIIYCNIQDLKCPLQPTKCYFGVREKILSSESCSMFLLNIKNEFCNFLQVQPPWRKGVTLCTIIPWKQTSSCSIMMANVVPNWLRFTVVFSAYIILCNNVMQTSQLIKNKNCIWHNSKPQ